MIGKTVVMLEMQDRMNSRVDPDWIDRRREWYRAIWIECAELMDHYGGWKWWKKSHRDVEQAMLEVVDIWHFGLSTRIGSDRDHKGTAAIIVDEWLEPSNSRSFLQNVESLAGFALREQGFLISMVPRLLDDLGRGFDDLYRTYVGKNVLNFFRQDHGYRDGSYVKTWDGREDNEHLIEILGVLDVDDAEFQTLVYAGLEERYQKHS
ncbi:MAG TPA: dUTP diphosphatase [Gammaproteobacteria bacterium]|nr:dUTP diphosphatase [Gammaproteobacteria bacterium]